MQKDEGERLLEFPRRTLDKNRDLSLLSRILMICLYLVEYIILANEKLPRNYGIYCDALILSFSSDQGSSFSSNPSFSWRSSVALKFFYRLLLSTIYFLDHIA